MSEGMEPVNPSPTSRSLEAAASEFRTRVEHASNRLNAAAEQFVAMSDALLSAVEEAREAAERARQSQHSVEELKQRMEADYGNVSNLVRDLQHRIGALATLAQPWPNVGERPSEGDGQEEHRFQEHQPEHTESGEQHQSSGYRNPGEASW